MTAPFSFPGSLALLMRIGFFFSLLIVVLLTGCAGYRLGSVGGQNLQGVSSIYIPVIKNQTVEPSIDVSTTSVLIRRFDKDGTLRTGHADADSELDVTLVHVDREALQTEQLDVQAATQFQITLIAQVTFINRRTGKKVLDKVSVSGTNSYLVGRDQVENERQALPMAEDDLARHIVSMVVEGW